ncbi:hypothetical protein BGZ63DRAFT_401228 [Mariannaea sp. PMI_226]|nr:hypothetical protein BGZ63DRAFT_401228 [Mariannaea sp. PMI_226]
MSSPPTSDVGFVQQGQVDWVSLSNTVIPLTIDILARLQGAGVQAITYAGALQLTSNFKLPELGRRRLWDAIQRLSVYNGASNLLYFGVGHRSLFRTLTETVSGLKCIALCSCLGEMHDETVAARILSALWHEVGYLEDYEPSLLQFRALIKACGGALATSPFPELANKLFPPSASSQPNICSDPQDVAKALKGLFDITMGVKKSITVIGGYDCAFIAAVAHWIFNLSVYVEDENGDPFFSSSVSSHPVQPSSAQVHIKYADVSRRAGIVISQSTYILKDPKELLLYMPDERLLHLRRRVSWDHCLYSVFGQTFVELKSLGTALGQLLGAVARISLALAEGEVSVRDQHSPDREGYIDFAEGSYGHGFIDSTRRIFPELSSPTLQQTMRSILPMSLGQAETKYEESMLCFRRSCVCSACTKRSSELRTYCLCHLAVTLVDLITAVSAFHIKTDFVLHPTFDGLKAFYARNDPSHFRQTGPLNPPLEMSSRRPILRRIKDTDVVEQLLEEALFLFTGTHSKRQDTLISKPRTALCASGICVFIEGMISMSTRADLLRRIHVIPGCIGRLNPGNAISVPREYDSVMDVLKWPNSTMQTLEIIRPKPSSPAISTEPVLQQELPALHDDTPLKSRTLEMTAEVIESGDAGEIIFFYRISTASGEVIVPPGKVTWGVLRKTGLINCDGASCSPRPTDFAKLFTVKTGWSLDEKKADEMELPWDACLDWGHIRYSELGRLAAFAVQYQTEDDEVSDRRRMKNRAILRTQECTRCCIRQTGDTQDANGEISIYHLI